MTHPLRSILDGVARGNYPPNDWHVDALPPLDGKVEVIVGLTGHCVLTGAFDDDARSRIAATDPSTAMTAPFLTWIAEQLDRRVGTYDALLLAHGTGAGAPDWLEPIDDLDHPRVQRAQRFRSETRTYHASDGAGVLIVGRGLCGRWELAYEVEPSARIQGLGRRLVAAARALVPDGDAIWAQVAPGNAASMRSTIAGGFTPVGSEVLFPLRDQ
jgi:GNAT superfamily N-acetyltransferase